MTERTTLSYISIGIERLQELSLEQDYEEVHRIYLEEGLYSEMDNIATQQLLYEKRGRD
jgi:hypothetical protein